MLRLATPQERLWFVIITAPLVLGAIPITLELGRVVGDFPVGQFGFNVLLMGVYVVLVGLASVLGMISAQRIHQVLAPRSGIERILSIDRTVALATIGIFTVYLAGIILLVASIIFPSAEHLGAPLIVVLGPLSPGFLLPTLQLPSTAALLVFVLVGASTGLWHAFLGFIIGGIFNRLDNL